MTTNRKTEDLFPVLEGQYSLLQDQLEQAGLEESSIAKAEKCIQLTRTAMEDLKQLISKHRFVSKPEEIQFFKEVKPKFYSLFIYYLKLYDIETRRPNATQRAEEKFLRKELRRLSYFFKNNAAFYQYYRTGASYLDEQYFLRSSQDLYLSLDPYYLNIDPSFCTSHDYKLSKLIASEKLQTFLQQALEKNNTRSGEGNTLMAKPVLTWTGSKAALIELIYALQSCGVYNNGSAEVKLIAGYFQEAFHVDLGNYYRTFQEIRIRKGSRTHFLELLTERLIKRMDETDEFGNTREVRGTKYEVRGKIERAKW